MKGLELQTKMGHTQLVKHSSLPFHLVRLFLIFSPHLAIVLVSLVHPYKHF